MRPQNEKRGKRKIMMEGLRIDGGHISGGIYCLAVRNIGKSSY